MKTSRLQKINQDGSHERQNPTQAPHAMNLHLLSNLEHVLIHHLGLVATINTRVAVYLSRSNVHKARDLMNDGHW